ncbi:MAG: hypothetical protein ACYC92_11370 [Candidatus Acidiferrales bacterium]
MIQSERTHQKPFQMTIPESFAHGGPLRCLTSLFSATKPQKSPGIRAKFLIGTPNVNHFSLTPIKINNLTFSNRDKFAFFRAPILPAILPAILDVDQPPPNPGNYFLAIGRRMHENLYRAPQPCDT